MLRRVPIGLLAITLVACATVKTGTDYDEQVDFGRYHSAAWLSEAVIVPPDSEPVPPMVVKRLRDAVEAELSRRDIEMRDAPDQADMNVAVVIGARQRIKRESYPVHSHHGSWGWCGAWCYDRAYSERTYTEGTVSVDLFDASSGAPIWHGWAQKSLKQADRADPKHSLEEAVGFMFEGFPPSN